MRRKPTDEQKWGREEERGGRKQWLPGVRPPPTMGAWSSSTHKEGREGTAKDSNHTVTSP